MISSNIIFSFTTFYVKVSFFLTKLLILGILFSKAVRASEIAKLVILDIYFLTSFILILRVVLVAKSVISGILSSVFLILELYTSFLTTSFLTKSLSLLESTEACTSLSTSNLSALFFKLLKLVGTFFNLSIFFYLHYILEFESNSNVTLSPEDFGSGKNSLSYTMSFFSIQLLSESLYPFHLTYSLSSFPFITFSTLNSF